MGWSELVTILGAQAALIGLVIGLQSFWIARAIDGLRGEMHRGFDRVDLRFDRLEDRVGRLERGGEPPSLNPV